MYDPSEQVHVRRTVKSVADQGFPLSLFPVSCFLISTIALLFSPGSMICLRPMKRTQMLAATGSDSLFDGSLLELIDDLEVSRPHTHSISMLA